MSFPGPGEYGTLKSERGSLVQFGKQNTFRMSKDDPLSKRTRNHPGPGSYNNSISDFGDTNLNTISVVFGTA